MRGLIFSIGLLISKSIFSQEIVRPILWAKDANRAEILASISGREWSNTYLDAYTSDVTSRIAELKNNEYEIFNNLPYDGDKSTFKYVEVNTPNTENGNYKIVMNEVLNLGVDCSVLYYLTQEEKYAEVASMVLQAMIGGLIGLELAPKQHNSGWITPDDHLYESRMLGSKIPVIYDFVYQYVKNNKVYDVRQKKAVAFNFHDAQQVFRTYVDLALNRGIIDCNWPILEANSLVLNTLCIDDKKERDSLLNYFLTINTANQDALRKVDKHYEESGGVWPESLNYSNAVAGYVVYLMNVVTNFDSKYKFSVDYPNIFQSLSSEFSLILPNKKEVPLFGDGHRRYRPHFSTLDMALKVAIRDGNTNLAKQLSQIITFSESQFTKDIKYKRNTIELVYLDPLAILWITDKIKSDYQSLPNLESNARLEFAGLTAIKNLSKNPKANDMMAVTSGGAYVHGHASGINLELYSHGHMLGVKNGRSAYRTDIHENYYRIFAAHNTVIVNGASQGEGGWVNLKIDTVKNIIMEPGPLAKPVSPNHTFSLSSFEDRGGKLAEASQQRTVGIVRVNDTIGFFVDIFRSKSDLPIQYHDYIYKNIGNELVVKNSKSNLDLKTNFTKDDQRYKLSAQLPWIQNRSYRNPGWHFFKNVNTWPKASDYKIEFIANHLKPHGIKMTVHQVATSNNELSICEAPPALQENNDYAKKPLPTMVVRAQGEQWSKPFCFVFEPSNLGSQNFIINTAPIIQNNKVVGIIINGNLGGENMAYYVLFNDQPSQTIKVENIEFKGYYSVVKRNLKTQKFEEIYIGAGEFIVVNGENYLSNEGAFYKKLKN
jgi:hypothetical protein